MPAIVAMRCNPVLKAFAIRLRASGKRGKQIVAAVMRRLLVLAYGVLKSGRAFDPHLGRGRRHSRGPVAHAKGQSETGTGLTLETESATALRVTGCVQNLSAFPRAHRPLRCAVARRASGPCVR